MAEIFTYSIPRLAQNFTDHSYFSSFMPRMAQYFTFQIFIIYSENESEIYDFSSFYRSELKYICKLSI